MRFLLCLLLVACASRVKVTSVCTDFARYARGTDTSEAAFNREVSTRFPAFYKWKIDKWTRDGKSPATELAGYVAEFPKIAPAYDRHCGAITGTVNDQVAKFSRIFPDFEEEIAVNVVHSLGEMDGGMRTIEGHNYFLIGIDGIARHHPDGDQTPFFHHELFHLYQETRVALSTDVLWGALWIEGLAVHASHVLNPNASPKELLLDLPVGAYAACDANIASLAATFRPLMRSRDDVVYADWFLLRGTSSTIPRRAGYCLGERVAARITGEIGLATAARLSGEALAAQIDAALAALSTTAEDSARLGPPPGADTSSKAGHTEPTE